MKRVVNNGSALKNGTTGNGKRRVHRDSYARRTARLMAMMARDGETEDGKAGGYRYFRCHGGPPA